jgi:hypothetical protein
MTISQSHDKIVTFRLEVKGLVDNAAMQKRIVEFLVEDMRENTELLDNAIARIRLNVFNSQRAQFHIRAKNSKDVKYMEALIGNPHLQSTEVIACIMHIKQIQFQECWTRGAWRMCL